MDFWDILSWASWITAGGLLLWMVADTIRVNRGYDEALLISSQEGLDDIVERGEVG